MIKWIRSSVVYTLLIMLIVAPVHASAATGLHPIEGAFLNDRILFEMDAHAVTPVGDDGTPVLPISYNGTTYLPVRAVGYLLGLGIAYESSTGTILINSKTDKKSPKAVDDVNKTNKLTRIEKVHLNGNLTFKIDDLKVVPLGQDGSPVLPISYNGTTYLPVRALGDLLGIGVDFDSQTNTVLLYKDGKLYIDDQGNEVAIVYGAKAFADKVVEYVPGNPAPTEKFQDSSKVLGEPDYVGSSTSTWDGFVSLGGGGQVTLEFSKVYLVDGPGADLHIFEVGPSVEAIKLEISKDNKSWIDIGEISGGTSSVDIGPYVSKGDQFKFVRLTDLEDNPTGATAGADIDAVAAVNNVMQGTVTPVKPIVPQEEPKTYKNDQGNEVTIDLGAKAFADRAVDYVVGDPAPTEHFRDASRALGEPDYTSSKPDDGYVSLGGSGQVIVEFTKVYLVDGPGADLHVFEVGPAVESMELEISKDNEIWINIGKISGGTSEIDIAPFVQKGDQFSFVRLTDLRDNTGGKTSGADVDAVAAVNGVLK